MAGGGGEGEFDVNINLTALLDVLTNLLFFLMFSFAAQQVNMELEGGIQLPTSTSDLPPKKAIQVMVGQRDLRVENNMVAPVSAGTIPGTGDPSTRIEPLYQRLVTLRDQRVAVARDAPDVLFVLADKATPYALLRRVLKTGAEAGFPKFRMAVLRE
ncbi:MAG: biopolymer transporter ExbD [Deltaproteobacteria bacterium]|nr:biopolymer transporter ExbD [Deltaproteobacteria bacterium]